MQPVRSRRGARTGCTFLRDFRSPAIVERFDHCNNSTAARSYPPSRIVVEGGFAMPSVSAGDRNGSRRVVPAKFAHAVLATKQFQPMVDWYTTVLQAEVVHSNGMLAFMTYDDEHHRIAIAAVPGLEDRPCHAVGLDHLAYTYASIGDLVFTYERLKQAGILPVVTINHGPTTSMYYRDPDGNRVELQVDNFDSVEDLKGFFQSDAMQKNPIGVNFNPDELARDFHAGIPESELKKYDATRGLDPATMRRLMGANQ
jgi:catechol 2,3-dioxygenase-like lactoylglutathione lyase family enzyme